ncbi:MAG: hypothetical protein JWN16_2300 [Alphaproteobacteria bacterium]|nr:hypothetical protein [Alphaproteobacteria bacterium]
MTAAAAKQAQFIAPDAYPQMMSTQDAARAMQTLRSATTAVKAQLAMEQAAPPMKLAILQYVCELEEFGTDMERVFEKAHEIRGFAETAGLITTGRISEILCRYMDDMARIGKPADAIIVALHVSAIAQAARAEKDDLAMGEIVAAELAALVARRLTEALR